MGSKLFTCGCLQTLEDACLTGLRHIQTNPLSPVIVLVPGNLLGLHLRRSLALKDGSPGHANIRFMTLVDLAREFCSGWFLRRGLQQPAPLLEQLLLDQVVSSIVPDGGYFAAARGQDFFCRSLYSTLTDLKEACISTQELNRWADTFSDPKEGGHKLKELAQIYHGYRSRFEALAFIDRNDLMDRAADFVDPSADFTLLIYGFYDFNPLQRKFLEALLQKREALIFFPWRESNAFDYALPSLTWLKTLGCEHIPLKPVKAGPIQRLALAIFDPPERGRNQEDVEAFVSVISAPGERREVQEIGRECLRWVDKYGFRFSDIGILLRNAEPYSSLFADTFSHLGIPYALHGRSPLWKNRAGQSFRLLLKIIAEDFSRTSVMEFITYAPINFDCLLDQGSHANPALWDLFSIKAGITRGRLGWQERLWRLYRRIQWEKEERKRSEGNNFETPPLISLEAFIAFLNLFFNAMEKIPRQGRWSDLAKSLSTLMRELLLPSPETQRIIEELVSLGHFDLLGEEVTLERFARAAESALSAAHESTNGLGKGGVFIGDLMSVRGLSFKAVIVPGMVEKFFPHPWRQDPILLDPERQYISEGLKKELAQKNRGYDEERLLFTLTLMAANERILFTFPRLEPLTGRERIPSFFLLRLMETVTGQPVNFADLEGWKVMRRISLSRLFPGESSEALDLLEYDLSQADKALVGKGLTPLGYLSSLSPFFSRSFKAEAERWGERLFTEFDGFLQSRRAQAFLRRLYPEKNTVLSPTRLELYARCPYRFFLEALLHLALLEEPDRFATLSSLDRGSLIHRILFLFLSRVKEEARLPLKSQELNPLERILTEVANDVLKEFEQDKATGFPLLWSLKKAEIMEDLKGWLDTEWMEEGEFLPTHLEVPFSCPLPINGKDGKEELRLQGHMDRIDLAREEARARVIDYKTGKLRLLEDGQFKGGEALQLPIYLYASSSLLKNCAVTEANYYYVSRKAKYRKVPFTRKDWENKVGALQGIVADLLSGIRNGLFMARPSSCGACPYPWICGPAANVLYDRKRQDPQIEFFERVKEIP